MAVHDPPCLTGETEVWGKCAPSDFAAIFQEVASQILSHMHEWVDIIIEKITAFFNAYHPPVTAYTYAYPRY